MIEIPGRPVMVLELGLSGMLSPAIARLTRHRGERHRTVCDHAAWLKQDHSGVIESTMPRVRVRSIEDVVTAKHRWGLLVEIKPLQDPQLQAGEALMAENIGRRYGWWSIVKQAGDGAINWVFGEDWSLFRRLRLPWVSRSPGTYNICSNLLCRGLKAAAWEVYGKVPKVIKKKWGHRIRMMREYRVEPLDCWMINPDDLMDDVMELRPQLYRVCLEYGTRPDYMPWRYVKKIEADLAQF